MQHRTAAYKTLGSETRRVYDGGELIDFKGVYGWGVLGFEGATWCLKVGEFQVLSAA